MSGPHRADDGAASVSAVRWDRVALFYGIAFGGMCLLGLAMWLAGVRLGVASTPLLAQLAVGFLGMPLPLVAGLVTEKVAGRRPLWSTEWRALRAGWRPTLAVALVAAVGGYLLTLGLTWLLGNVAGLPVGRLGTVAELEAALTAQVGVPVSLPVPPAAIVGLGLLAGVVAGFTINGVFAFGEEYGWRGVLADELAPLGAMRATLLTGLLWGLWHAPLILLGFNYDGYGNARAWLGILVMVAWVTPLSAVLARARRHAGTITAPAIIHGAINGTTGVFLLVVVARDPLLAAPVGLLQVATTTLLAVTLARLFPRTS